LWGRSMGAATALMYGDRDPDIACMILDSSFCDLVQLAEEMVEKGREQGIVVPNVVVSAALKMIQWSVEKHAHFSIRHISPMSHADRCFIPALFVAGEQDDFIKPHHSEAICLNYGGHKNLMVVHGDHNDPRPKQLFDAAASFLQKYLDIPDSAALPVHGSMNLMKPPWYHKKWRPPTTTKTTTTTTTKTKTENGGGNAVDASSSLQSPEETTTGFDSEEMGMTEERQREIQTSLFKMLGHEEGEKEEKESSEAEKEENSEEENGIEVEASG
jgi:hypothetical protein